MHLWKYGGGKEIGEDAGEESGGKAPYVGCGSGYKHQQDE